MVKVEQLQPRQRGFFTGVVVRLRLGLFLIVLVTSAACFAGLYQSRQISAAHDSLDRNTMPSLILIHQAERDLNRIFLILERTGFVTSQKSLDQIGEEFASAKVIFRETIGQLKPAQSGAEDNQRLINNFASLEQAVEGLFSAQKDHLVAQSQIDLIRQNLTQIQVNSRELVQRLTIETTLQVENLLREARSGEFKGSSLIDQLFSDLFLASLNLVSLSTDLETVIDLSKALTIENNSDTAGSTHHFITAKFTRIVALLTQLDAGVERTQLARLTSDLRGLLLNEDGLLAHDEARKAIFEERRALQQTWLSVAAEISSLVTELANEAQANVRISSERLSTATDKLNVVLTLFFLVAAIAILVGNFIFVEKQVNRRMGRLNTAVRSIAGGDLEHDIDIRGRDEIGDIARALAVFKETALELRRSNVDLERFAYVAAHDLRSPLRAIHDLADWTLEDEDNVLSEDSKEYLDMLQQRINRLNRLLADLLDYARAGQDGSEESNVSIVEVVSQIASLLDAQDKFNVTYTGPPLEFSTFATPLRQILMNLISNAIKHHDNETGNVMVTAHVQQNRVVLTVTDDGPGIPKEYQERVFNLFQTLRPRDEVEGSGLGLAIIRKLLDRYKGGIQVQSTPEEMRGTSFTFDLPVLDDIDAASKPQVLAAE